MFMLVYRTCYNSDEHILNRKERWTCDILWHLTHTVCVQRVYSVCVYSVCIQCVCVLLFSQWLTLSPELGEAVAWKRLDWARLCTLSPAVPNKKRRKQVQTYLDKKKKETTCVCRLVSSCFHGRVLSTFGKWVCQNYCNNTKTVWKRENTCEVPLCTLETKRKFWHVKMHEGCLYQVWSIAICTIFMPGSMHVHTNWHELLSLALLAFFSQLISAAVWLSPCKLWAFVDEVQFSLGCLRLRLLSQFHLHLFWRHSQKAKPRLDRAVEGILQ